MIGNAHNLQSAIYRMSEMGEGRKRMKYHAFYARPMERVVFSPHVNPMLLLFEGLWVLSGRPVQEGMASYGPKMYGAKIGTSITVSDRVTEFRTKVCNNRLEAEVHTTESADLYQLVSDAVCFSMVQEGLAHRHGLDVGTFFHSCGDVSNVDPGGQWYDPYSSDMLITCRPFPSESFYQHLGMFLDEGAALGMRDPFLNRVAGPVVEGLKHYLGTATERFDNAMDAVSVGHIHNDWCAASAAYIDFQRKVTS